MSVVVKPWGTSEVLYSTARSNTKLLHIYPGESTDTCSHLHKVKSWIFISGSAIIDKNNIELILSEGDTLYIPIGNKYKISNKGLIICTLIEVELGSYLGEDDVIYYDIA